MSWKTLLAYITGTVDQELLLRNEYLVPPRSPNLNAFAERWVRSVKDEVLSRLILFGEASLWHVLQEYEAHYHTERNHQGKGNVLLFPLCGQGNKGEGPIQCRERLGGLLKYYYHDAA